MLAIWNAVNGAKTYIVAAVALAAAWVGFWNGTVDLQTAIDATFAALGLGALRHAMPAK